MLQIETLNITMKKDLRVLVEGLSLTLNPGDKCAVVGEEGNGKSTLLKWIYNPELVENYAECEGTCNRDGLLMGYLAQEVTAEEKVMSVYTFCCEEQAFLDADAGELARCAKSLQMPISLFYENQPLGSLSGGEKVKLRLALLMLQQPDLWLLDEPSNDLDVDTLLFLEGFIQTLPAPVLFISHDETLLERTATMILHIEQLRRKQLPRHVVARCGYHDYVETRLKTFAHQTQVAKKEQSQYEKQQARFRQIYQRVAHEQSSVSPSDPHTGRLLKKKMKAVKSLEHRIEREQAQRTELPDTEEAILVQFSPEIHLPAGKTVLDFHLPTLQVADRVLATNLSLHVCGPTHLGITGKNGAGKTTLLKEIAAQLLSRTDIHAAYMPQDYEETLDMSKTPVAFLAPSGDKADITRAQTLLGSMKYTPEEFAHPMAALSGGQKAKLFFVEMILSGSDVLLLDEPTRNFSPLSNPVIRQMLSSFGGAIISVSHDRKYIEEVCDTVYELTCKGLTKRNE